MSSWLASRNTFVPGMKMPDFNELQQKVSRDMQPMSAKSPYKPEIAAQTEEEPENLRRFIFSLETLFSGEFIEDTKWDIGNWLYDKQHNLIAVQFKTWIYGEHLKTRRVYFPRNWFEHLKERVLPAFLRDYWPVKTQCIEVDIQALYPKLRKKLEMPEELHVVHGVMKHGDGVDREDEKE